MRFQPSLPEMLEVASRRLDRAAAECDDPHLSRHLLGSLARLLEHAGQRFDTYVACRLDEIERLGVLLGRVGDHLAPDDRSALDAARKAADEASGRLPVSRLEALCDDLNSALIEAQTLLEARADPTLKPLLDEIFAEQVNGLSD